MGVPQAVAAPAEAFVEFRGVSKSYDGQHPAVRDLSCSIRKGEFLAFLGPSGSGKTTALMMLAGFETPDIGDILLAGRSLSRVPPHRRNMGVVFQNYALFPHMTVEQNVAFPLTVRPVARAGIQEKVAHALARVQLSGFERRRPTELSGGQQQRVALARALVFGPNLILMDEPLGALDKQLREQLQIEIKQIQRELGVTVIYVTHDQSEALALSDRIAVFKSGTIQQIAAPRDLYEHPVSSFVAQFVGQSNLLPGRLLAVDGVRCAARTAGGLLVRAHLAGSGSPGDATMLIIRPERLVIGHAANSLKGRPPSEGVNLITARIAERVYQGDHARIRVVLEDGTELMVRSEASPDESLVRGDVVPLGWLAEHCRAFADTPSAGKALQR
jgi:putative spermidine/putrescine transport system ATP-binding protein